METDLVRRIAGNPRYQQLKAKRSGLGWTLTLAMLVVYYGFILLVAFGKPFLSTRLERRPSWASRSAGVRT